MLKTLSVLTIIMAVAGASAAQADPKRDAILASLSAEAKAANASFTGFSADAGKAFWFADHTGGKPDTPSCTTCHTKDPKAEGQTRAGKAIKAMAVSVNPDRFTDPDQIAKWFGRNCTSVLGRECTAEEKGNVITFLAAQ